MATAQVPGGSTRWRILLRDGVQITVLADGTFINGLDRVFELALGSRPVTLLEILRVREDQIDDFESFIDEVRP